MNGTKKRGLTLVELLISMGILMIIGGVAVMALNTMFLVFRQNDEQIAARSEIEFAFNELRPRFSNIGLGIPNNKTGSNSFRLSFAGLSALPVGMNSPIFISGDGKFFYAYSEPTGVRLNGEWHSIAGGAVSPPTLELRAPSEMSKLQEMGLSSDTSGVGNNPNHWILFPSLRIPLCVSGITGNSLTVGVKTSTISGDLRGYEEIHLLRVGRLYVESGDLKQQINGASPKTIAANIINVSFDFEPGSRLLTMKITARGNAGESRELKEEMTWRIIN